MTSLFGIALIIGPMIIGFFVFILIRILKGIASIGTWIADFVREVRNKPKYRKQDPYVN
mgnify:CR=1 FL=1